MNRPKRSVLNVEILLLILLAVPGVLAMTGGCGRPATVVGGIVTLDSKPVEKAIVQFIPERRDAPTVVAITDSNGKYEVPITPVPFQVTIVAQKFIGQKKDDSHPEGGLMDVYEDVLPSLYADPTRSHLRAEPAEGRRTVVDFQLSSRETN